ncbi:MAG: hypothetical protein ACR2II_05055 [Chthoniobacterales bacterium]
MKTLLRHLPHLLLTACFAFGIATAGAEEEKTIEFQGTVSAVDPEAKTITIRARQKDFVFQIDPPRCNVVKDGKYPFIPGSQSPVLGSARIGDSAVGTLVVEHGKPVVTDLYLTTKPEPGERLKEKPGFITSPYHFISPLSLNTIGRGAIDVRGYRRGTLLVDESTGKIFLVP